MAGPDAMPSAGPGRAALTFGAHLTPPKYLTGDLPPIGGRIKERPEDFLVDEVPLYEPSGAGEHIYMLVEKREISTLHLVRLLASHFGVDPWAVGYAGLKDKHAITRQVVSVHVPGRKIESFPSVQHERVQVLWADYHENKLRVGHLKGNRFSIRVRGVDPSRVVVVKKALDRLAGAGVPNRIGEQRFGNLENNHLIGRALILGQAEEVVRLLLAPDPAYPENLAEARALYARGEHAAALEALPRAARTERSVLGALSRGGSAQKAARQIGGAERSFYVAAFQSAIFNAVLDERLAAGTLAALALGDAAFKHDNGAVFDVDEEAISRGDLAERLARLEVSPSGPMWGVAMKRSAGVVDGLELEALAASGVSLEQLSVPSKRSGLRAEGARRPLRVPLTDHDVDAGVDEHGPYIRCVFDLPRGAFATSVLREIMKPERAGVGVARLEGDAE
jgi:tRNA pseudouridine13 synthase